MIGFQKPNIDDYDIPNTNSDDSRISAGFKFGPLERGYGITFGNSMRRILLSSLPGYAITSAKIRGGRLGGEIKHITHEFTSIDGVREDITEIILNLKEVILKMEDASQPQIITINAQNYDEEPLTVTAGDIIVDSNVEILNPTQVIATLEKDTILEMELSCNQGRGYNSAEANRVEIEHLYPQMIDTETIPIDSIYSPVTKVNYTVENTRVGDKTDFDLLRLEVTTNGTMTPGEAVSYAAKILIDHLECFQGLTEKGKTETMEEINDNTGEETLEKTIEELELSVRSFNCLKRANIHKVRDLIEKSEEDMMRVRNLGRKSLDEIIEKLAALGLALRKEED